jgi:cell division GTPase FtsZ
MKMANQGIDELSKCLDTLIVVPNENVFRVANIETSFDECNEIINRTLYDGVSAISSLITKRGRINIDFADVKTIMAFIGKAMFGVGQASGDDRAVIAAKTSISNPMLDGINLRDAKGLLISITANTEITPVEIDAATNVIQNEVNNPDECEIITGVFMDEELGDELIVATVATGMNDQVEDRVVEIETSTNNEPQDFTEDVQPVDLEVRKVNQDYPVNTEDYPDLIDEDSEDQQIENEVAEESAETRIIEDLPEPEDWENDDVPLFKSDRLDNNEDDKDFDSQMEIPAFLRKNKQ